MSALKLILIIIGSAFVIDLLVVVEIIIMFRYAAMKIAGQEGREDGDSSTG